MNLEKAKTSRSYEELIATQFSLFLANRVGQLREMLEMLHQQQLPLLGISVVDATDWAVIRVIVADPDKAREMLKAKQFPFTESPVLLVCVQDDAALAKACSVLMQAEVNVHFAYALTIRHDDCPVMVFHVDDTVIATQILVRHQFVLLGEEDLMDPGKDTGE